MVFNKHTVSVQSISTKYYNLNSYFMYLPTLTINSLLYVCWSTLNIFFNSYSSIFIGFTLLTFYLPCTNFSMLVHYSILYKCQLLFCAIDMSYITIYLLLKSIKTMKIAYWHNNSSINAEKVTAFL